MEPIFLTCMVLAYFFSKTKVDTTAYANGKESPGVTKARLRHESGGGARSAKGRPQGTGAFRLVLASRWANACEAARQRGDHKAKRRRDWFEKTKDDRDEKWQGKMQRRLERADERRSRWADRLAGLSPAEMRSRRKEDAAWRENAQRDAEPVDDEATVGDVTKATPDAVPDPAVNRKIQDQVRPGAKPTLRPRTPGPIGKPTAGGGTGAGKSPQPVGNAPTTEGQNNVYMDAVTKLTRAADGVAAWRNGLKQFGDGLEAKGWGQQVTGVIKDMITELNDIEGVYRDRAAQMKQQGDNGKAAYEQAPWVPSAEAALA
jgi:hypothetical protein